MFLKLIGLAFILQLLQGFFCKQNTTHDTSIKYVANKHLKKDTLISLPDFEYKMVWIEGGNYQMGSNKGRDDEKPIHNVNISNFFIGQTEITQYQWESIMGNNPSEFKECKQCPVEQVSWDDIQIFLKKINEKTGQKYRLPTEEEWEYVARGGKESKSYLYAGGNNIKNVAWFKNNSNGKTHPVGKKSPNELGIYDMTGNVYEWTSSGWCADYQKSRDSFTYVLRGGSWNYEEESCRSTYRIHSFPDSRDVNFGFRIVLSN
jgi:sulfatase modifying factor 1